MINQYSNKNKNKFFEELAIDVGITDVKVVRDFYYGLVKNFGKSIKRDGKVRWPDIGEFLLMDLGSHKIGNTVVGASKVVRFKADYKLKDYFKSLKKK